MSELFENLAKLQYSIHRAEEMGIKPTGILIHPNRRFQFIKDIEKSMGMSLSVDGKHKLFGLDILTSEDLDITDHKLCF